MKREFLNPFTREKTIVETREPEWSDEEPEVDAFHPQVVSVQGDYQAYLESRLSPFVRGQPHWAGKGLTALELEALFEALGFDAQMEPAMYSPPSFGSMLDQLPTQFLSGVRVAELGDVSKRWAAAMSRPEHTHSVTGRRVADGWKAEDALAMLRPLAELACRAAAGQQMYLLTEM